MIVARPVQMPGVEKSCETCGFGVDGCGRNLAALLYAHGPRSVFLCSHNSPLVMRLGCAATAMDAERFPRFHSAHHNNKLYGSSKFRKDLL
jgi:hypothetical protein